MTMGRLAGRRFANALGKRGWLAALAASFLSVALLLLVPKAHAQVSKEYQLKAAFLYNFTKFVEWAPEHFKTAESPIVIGMLAKNPFGPELERIVQGRKVNGRELVIKTVGSPGDVLTIDLLFTAAGEEPALANLLDPAHAAGVLTVGESQRFTKLGGIITFTMEADKVRFEINQEMAEKARLKISSQLLKLAVVVRKKP